MSAADRRFRTHPRVAALYPELLFVVHAITRGTVPLMETALERARELDGDRAAFGVSEYLDDHIPDERGHDEWLLEDVELLGVERARVLRRPPPASVASLIGATYYWVLHFHPVAVLGLLMAGEGYPPSAEALDELRRATGHPAGAFRTLMEHADLDQGHGTELADVIDGLPLTKEQSTVLGLAAMHSVAMMAQALDELVGSLDD